MGTLHKVTMSAIIKFRQSRSALNRTTDDCVDRIYWKSWWHVQI